MKIKAFKVMRLSHNVDGLALTEADFEFDHIIDGRLADMPCCPPDEVDYPGPELALLRAVIDDPEDDPVRLPVARLKARRRGRTVSFAGVLMYRTDYELADFLVKDYVPSGLTEVDSFLLKHKGRFSKAGVKSRLVEIVEEASNFRRSRRKGNSPIKYFPALKEDNTWFSRQLVLYSKRKGESYYLFCPDGPRLYYLEDRKRVDGKFVPVRSFFFMQNRRREKGLFWDGVRGTAAEWDGLDGRWLSEFKEKGRIKIHEKEEVFPRIDLETEFVLRMPSRKEAARFEGGRVIEKLAPGRIPGHPLYLRDSREAVAIPGGCPVIDGVKDALYALSRTVDRVFVPGDMTGNPVESLGREPRFLAAMRVKDE